MAGAAGELDAGGVRAVRDAGALGGGRVVEGWGGGDWAQGAGVGGLAGLGWGQGWQFAGGDCVAGRVPDSTPNVGGEHVSQANLPL
jgi:hypothetical protein